MRRQVAALLALIFVNSVFAVPMPVPIASKPLQARRAVPTPAPSIHANLDFYHHTQQIPSHDEPQQNHVFNLATPKQWAASRVQKRDDYPSFPAQYPSWSVNQVFREEIYQLTLVILAATIANKSTLL